MGITAPPHKQALLLELVACDVSLSRANSAVKNLANSLHIPTLVGAAEEIKVRRHDVVIETESIKAELARAESDVQIVEARILKDQERLATTSSPKDAAGLEHEVSSLVNRRSDLEDIELAIMEKLDALNLVMAGLDQELETADTALGVAKNEEALELARLEREIKHLGEAREALVADLPEDLYSLYERQRERYGLGASHLRGGISTASGVALTESDLQTVRKAPADQVLMCPDSNAILVRTSESGL
jgi:predicted  nucleic acid-binding Zn-ribbon protein